MKQNINKRGISASADNYPLLTAAAVLFLYFTASHLFSRYWTPLLNRTLPRLGVRYMNPFLASAGMLGALTVFLIVLYRMTGQIRIFRQSREPFFRGLIPGGYLLFIAILSILWELLAAEQYQSAGTIVCSIVYFILVAVTEELVFRGMVADLLLRGFWRQRKDDRALFAALVLSGVIFSLAHATNLRHAEPMGVCVQMIGAFLMGMVITAVYYRTANIWVVIALHAVNDIAAALPVTVLRTDSSLSDVISGYGAAELWSLVPYAVVLAVILRKPKRDEIKTLWGK